MHILTGPLNPKRPAPPIPLVPVPEASKAPEACHDSEKTTAAGPFTGLLLGWFIVEYSIVE